MRERARGVTTTTRSLPFSPSITHAHPHARAEKGMGIRASTAQRARARRRTATKSGTFEPSTANTHALLAFSNDAYAYMYISLCIHTYQRIYAHVYMQHVRASTPRGPEGTREYLHDEAEQPHALVQQPLLELVARLAERDAEEQRAHLPRRSGWGA